MHNGHPDFLNGFWAKPGRHAQEVPGGEPERGHLRRLQRTVREEKSPHIDVLVFEKGREATLNAASNFFSKIAGGSVSVIRSRVNHLLCERIGLLGSLSFYFSSVAFYTSNLLIDMSIYLYVMLLILFPMSALPPSPSS